MSIAPGIAEVRLVLQIYDPRCHSFAEASLIPWEEQMAVLPGVTPKL